MAYLPVSTPSMKYLTNKMAYMAYLPVSTQSMKYLTNKYGLPTSLYYLN